MSTKPGRKGLTLKRQEWKRLLHNPLLLVVMVAIIAIPTIYTTLFLGSM